MPISGSLGKTWDGVVVADDKLGALHRTSIEGVFAAGDCQGRMPKWQQRRARG